MNEVYENFSGVLQRAERKTALSRAMFYEDVETMKSYTLQEILETEKEVDALSDMTENAIDYELEHIAMEKEYNERYI